MQTDRSRVESYNNIIVSNRRSGKSRLRIIYDLQLLVEICLKHRDDYGLKGGIKGVKSGWIGDFWEAVARDLQYLRSGISKLGWQACQNNMTKAVARRREELEEFSG